MSANEFDRGPALVFTTPYLRKAPRRVAISTDAFSLPGTYQLSRVIGAVAGAFAFAIPGFILIAITGSWYPLIIFLTIGGLTGIFAATWKSSTGESAARSLQLFTAKRTGLVKIGDRYVRAYVGACRLQRSCFGPVQMIAESTESKTAADQHGEFVTSTLIRPSSRPSTPRVGADTIVLPDISRSTSGSRASKPKREGLLARLQAAIEDIRRQLASNRSRTEHKKQFADNRRFKDRQRSRQTSSRALPTLPSPPSKEVITPRKQQIRRDVQRPAPTPLPAPRRPRTGR